MSQQLINHSPDLKRLWDEGYQIDIKGAMLLMYRIPYLNSSKEIKYGTLVSTLHLAGDRTHTPDTHVAYFVGEAPCTRDGRVMSAIIISSNQQALAEQVIINQTFSSKPPAGYADYYEKMTTYANIVAAPAKSLDDSVTERAYQVRTPDASTSVFNYLDTNSARARINTVSLKLQGLKLAIVGLGGTGSYILDLVAKAPVQEIHLFDGDVLMQHNAFRAPGAPTVELLRERVKKTDYLRGIYLNMHRNIHSHNYDVEASNLNELADMNFVFLSLDKGEPRRMLVNYLQEKNIPFVDVGMGLQNVDDALLGIVRVTASSENQKNHVLRRVPFTEAAANEYGSNIQIADLNALNAAMAVIKWKKMFGFYQDYELENHSTYTMNVNMLLSDDHSA